MDVFLSLPAKRWRGITVKTGRVVNTIMVSKNEWTGFQIPGEGERAFGGVWPQSQDRKAAAISFAHREMRSQCETPGVDHHIDRPGNWSRTDGEAPPLGLPFAPHVLDVGQHQWLLILISSRGRLSPLHQAANSLTESSRGVQAGLTFG
ncbi:uncharacterized protein BO87DRAFT_400949 [Aspergillus neoniger CBS 115656]|uniref:Uncharacterized protein n=1 Tax=Aspergillus neoniger (strain CBS 115656) TaxID=1448310 RepID=A0A318YNL0_ASPNB|nr:hypothetical protein BO87DRAFT_400949 [Aspergillus neoniger CBS 115656]PYH29788.1 hypothetical protein BO87DRAFT_400949 [Aspergillus neoniger CBS 115656]